MERLLIDGLADEAAGPLLRAAMTQFYAFTLVLVRMSGLMIVGPMFGQSVVPANVRILLALTLAFVITPTLADQARIGFERLDANGDGLLAREEVPAPLAARFEQALARAGHPQTPLLSPAEYRLPLGVPETLFEFARIALGELALGFLLGLGVLTIFSALQLAGDLIDQQTGIGLSEVFSPGLDVSASISARFLFLTGITVFLLMEPVGGHLLMVSALVETFQTLPVGEAFVAVPAIEYARDLLHQSLVLAVQIAAPMLAVMSMVALTMGYLGHSVPQINVLVVGFAVRAMVNLLVLALTFSGAAKAVVDTVPAVIDRMRFLLTSLGGP